MTETNTTIGDAIRAARRQKGITIEHMASLMDPPVTKAAVSAWETGRNRIKADALDQICSILEVDAGSLMPTKFSYDTVEFPKSDREKDHEEMAQYMNRMSETQRSAMLGVARAMIE